MHSVLSCNEQIFYKLLLTLKFFVYKINFLPLNFVLNYLIMQLFVGLSDTIGLVILHLSVTDFNI